MERIPDSSHLSPAAFPDHLFGAAAFPEHKSKPGLIRAALAPFKAHAFMKRSNQQYKWMLYGDDDTFFEISNVLKLLERLDHNEPLALSDNLWYDP